MLWGFEDTLLDTALTLWVTCEWMRESIDFPLGSWAMFMYPWLKLVLVVLTTWSPGGVERVCLCQEDPREPSPFVFSGRWSMESSHYKHTIQHRGYIQSHSWHSQSPLKKTYGAHKEEYCSVAGRCTFTKRLVRLQTYQISVMRFDFILYDL